MATKISIHNFTFLPLGCGKYLVEYKSPVSGKTWRQHITNAALISATKGSISPKPKDLKALMFVCKNRYYGPHPVNG